MGSSSFPNRDLSLVRAACRTMAIVASNVIVPLAFAAVATGLLSSLGTPWGLFRHYWVALKLALTLIATVVLLVQIAPIGRLAEIAADPASRLDDFAGARRPLSHSIGGADGSRAVQVLGVYKPRGLTRYGWRKQRDREAAG